MLPLLASQLLFSVLGFSGELSLHYELIHVIEALSHRVLLVDLIVALNIHFLAF